MPYRNLRSVDGRGGIKDAGRLQELLASYDLGEEGNMLERLEPSPYEELHLWNRDLPFPEEMGSQKFVASESTRIQLGFDVNPFSEILPGSQITQARPIGK